MTEPNDTGAETEGDKADIVERGKETERWLFSGRKSERKSMRHQVVAWVCPGQVVLWWVGQGSVDCYGPMWPVLC